MTPETIEQLFGTLIESTTAAWRKHLKTDSHNVHMSLNDFYEEIPELVDALIEAYQGIYGKVEGYENMLDDASEMTAIEYLETLRDICKNGRDLLNDETELESDMDAILDLISSTLYKLKELDSGPHTNESLSDYLTRVLC